MNRLWMLATKDYVGLLADLLGVKRADLHDLIAVALLSVVTVSMCLVAWAIGARS